MPDSLEEKFTRADRDMIVTLNTKMETLIGEVKDLKNNTVNRISNLELDKVDKNEYSLLEKRVDKTEKAISRFVGIAIAISLLAGLIGTLLSYIYFSDINRIKTDLEKHIEQVRVTN